MTREMVENFRAARFDFREEEPKVIAALGKVAELDIELRDDPTMHPDQFRLMSRPGGRDVTELYAVA